MLTMAYSVQAATPSERLAQAAAQSEGKQMWGGYGLSSGKLGCAAALCNVFKSADVSKARSDTVTAVRSRLLAEGCTEVMLSGKNRTDEALRKNSAAGDILLAFMQPPSKPNGGPNAHCGILVGGADICTNDWMDGIWKRVNVHLMFDYFPYWCILHLPAHDRHKH
jgi:hypothetical protein